MRPPRWFPVVSAGFGAARRSDRRPGQTIRKVLDAGLQELRESSYANLTMRAVATRAGVSPASAYTYFPSKSALVAAVYLRFLRELPLHTDVNDTTRTRVSATMRDMAVVVADEPELTTACGAALMADDPAVTPLREQIGRGGVPADRRCAGPRVAALGEVHAADDVRRRPDDGPVRQFSRDRGAARRSGRPDPGRPVFVKAAVRQPIPENPLCRRRQLRGIADPTRRNCPNLCRPSAADALPAPNASRPDTSTALTVSSLRFTIRDNPPNDSTGCSA